VLVSTQEKKLKSLRNTVTLLIIFVCCFLAGCGTTIANLSKPTEPKQFTLEKDHVRTQIRGLGKYKWVEGLRAGTYEAVGQDETGTYFIGPGASVISLTEERADKYLQTGELPPAGNGGGALLGAHPGVGGLFIPNNLDKDEPKLFILNKVSPGLGALTFLALQASLDGTLAYVPYGTELDFVRNLRIVKKTPL
jgi:hypothetical protein